MTLSLFPKYKLPFMDRIFFEPMSGCWIWGGAWTSAGYGMIHINGNRVYAHRFSYEMHKGPIPEGLTIDHLCKNTACCNPDHLEAVTMRVNLHRSNAPCAKNAIKTHCPKGHPLIEGNIDVKIGKYGPKRECSVCRRNRNRLIYQNLEPDKKHDYIARTAFNKKRRREERVKA